MVETQMKFARTCIRSPLISTCLSVSLSRPTSKERSQKWFETRLLPTLTRSYPCRFTFYVADPVSSIDQSLDLRDCSAQCQSPFCPDYFPRCPEQGFRFGPGVVAVASFSAFELLLQNLLLISLTPASGLRAGQHRLAAVVPVKS